MNITIDVVIPTCRPDGRLLEILSLLGEQSTPPANIFLINTGHEGLDELLRGNALSREDLIRRHPGLVIRDIEAQEFDHAGTRNMGMDLAAKAGADFTVLMTQDALPAGRDLLERLTAPMLRDQEIAVSYARQLPNPGADVPERLTRQFNYPDVSRKKTIGDLKELGVKTFFCSDVCAAYRMDVFREVGGFSAPAIFNEDMVYAASAMRRGYAVQYAADAAVVHSHRYSASRQFHRNFDLGVSQADHPEVFACSSSEHEGVRYVRCVLKEMAAEHSWPGMPGFIIGCAARLIGYRLGKNYRHLSRKMILRCTSNEAYWHRVWNLQ